MHSVDDVVAALAALHGSGAAYVYPDADNALERTVFTFKKREDEANGWLSLVEKVVPKPWPSPARALDAGCGLGAYVGGLREVFRAPLFLDADAGRAARAAAGAGEAPGRAFFAVDLDDARLRAAPFSSSFAFVQCIQVLGHVPRDRVETMLATMASLLAPGGALLLAVPFTGHPVDDFWITFLSEEARPKPMQTSGFKYDALARAPETMKLPVRHFSMTTLRHHCAAAGLVVEETLPYNWFDDVRGDLFALCRRAA